MNNRQSGWNSRIGFLMAAVGSAVGFGNLWAFPYKMGSCGGGVFLLLYLLLLMTVGYPLLLGEIAIGRHTGQGPWRAFRASDPKFGWVGPVSVLAGLSVLAYYQILGGICLRYCLGFALELLGKPGFFGLGAGFFSEFLEDFPGVMLYAGLFAALTGIIVRGGVSRGIERFSAAAMPVLFGLLLTLAVYIAGQPGAGAGYRFLFCPDWTALRGHFLPTLTAAAGQMFFSLSIAMGTMVTYGAYLSRREPLSRDAAVICAADTVIALLAGCVLLPGAFVYAGQGAEITGSGLLFGTMHRVFLSMPRATGIWLGLLFFLAVLLAAWTSAVAMAEVGVNLLGKTHRGRSAALTMGISLILAAPVAWTRLGGGLTVCQRLGEGLLMPLGALGICGLLRGRRCEDWLRAELGNSTAERLRWVCGWWVPAVLILIILGQTFEILTELR